MTILLTIYAWLAVILLGFRTIYTDVTLGKIRNKDLLWGIVAALGFLVFSFGIGLQEGVLLSSAYLWEYCWNVVIGLLVGYVFWRMSIWSAGDAKLFVVFLALIPLSWYQHGYISGFPGLVLLVNSILPLAGFLLVRLVWMLLTKGRLGTYIKGFRVVPWQIFLWEVVQFLVLFFVGRLIVGIVFVPLRALLLDMSPVLGAVIPQFHNHNTAVLFAFVLLLLLRRWVRQSLVRHISIVVAVFMTIGIQLVAKWITWSDIEAMLVGPWVFIAFGLVVLRVTMLSLVHFVRVKPVRVDALHEGLLLTPHSVAQLQSKDSVYFASFTYEGDGLDPQQIAYIQQWYLDHKEELQPNESLEVYQTTAFAPFLFLGAVLTGVLQQMIL